MLRAHKIVSAGAAQASAGEVLLDYEGRFRRRIMLQTTAGLEFLLDLEQAALLADGDILLLDDGRTVLVRAADEALLVVRAADARSMLRIAWHLGNRHLPTMLEADHIIIRDDYVIADMLRGLGADVTTTQGPFTPERGAYSVRAPEHHHHHDH
jgi:urease accessory protein